MAKAKKKKTKKKATKAKVKRSVPARKKPAKKAKAKKTSTKKSTAGKARKTATKTKMSSAKKSSRTVKTEFQVHEARIFAKSSDKLYCVVEAKSVDDLVREVQVRMNDGWEPEGGILHTAGCYLQAMAVD